MRLMVFAGKPSEMVYVLTGRRSHLATGATTNKPAVKRITVTVAFAFPPSINDQALFRNQLCRLIMPEAKESLKRAAPARTVVTFRELFTMIGDRIRSDTGSRRSRWR